jgi:peptidyl-prolyl cis-trans isomerase C
MITINFSLIFQELEEMAPVRSDPCRRTRDEAYLSAHEAGFLFIWNGVAMLFGPLYRQGIKTQMWVAFVGRFIMAKVEARHILVDTEELCEELKAKIEDGANFSDIAKEHSSCPSGAKGGELGSFGLGEMVPEFDQVVFSAPINDVQGPVKTQFGYHLLEVTNRTD